MSPNLNDSAAQEAIQYIRDAEKMAANIPSLPADVRLQQIASTAVIGAGTMGGGIAMTMANAGLPVILVDSSHEALERGMGRINANYAGSVSRGRISQDDAAGRIALIRPTTDITDIVDADIVIEAVFESMPVKLKTFTDIDRVAKPGAILATNTSALDINEIAKATRRPDAVVGAHFFSPANVMRLLEVVQADRTSHEVLATLMNLAPKLGKIAVLARVYDGFIGNAMFAHYIREAHFLVEEGAEPCEVDKALTDFGFAMGIFAVQDLAGNDVGYHSLKQQLATTHDRRLSELTIRLCDAGRLGQKTGKGWYNYSEGSRTPLPDTDVTRIIEAEAARQGIVRRHISPQEIVERCLFSMINEGFRLLEKGIALRASDIDVVYVTDYGFPATRGGPMYYAKQRGMRNIHDEIERLREVHGPWWEPAPLLARAAS